MRARFFERVSTPAARDSASFATSSHKASRSPCRNRDTLVWMVAADRSTENLPRTFTGRRVSLGKASNANRAMSLGSRRYWLIAEAKASETSPWTLLGTCLIVGARIANMSRMDMGSWPGSCTARVATTRIGPELGCPGSARSTSGAGATWAGT